MNKSVIAPSVYALITTLFLASDSLSSSEQSPWTETTPALAHLTDLPSGDLSADELETLRAIGEQLFRAKFTVLDGAGRPDATQAILPTRPRRVSGNAMSRTAGPDAAACASCHNDPIVGGAGDFVTNVFVSEGFTNTQFDSTDPQFSNERGTNHLFGAGLVELLAREMSADLAAIRNEALYTAYQGETLVHRELTTKGVSFGTLVAYPDGIVDLSGVDGVDTDLVIRPFSQKGVMTSLRQFTINAMNHHHGMQANERFGVRWTGDADFDGDGVENELSSAEVSALVAWQATLPPPVVSDPDNKEWEKAANLGQQRFKEFGCNACHRQALPLSSLKFADPGPVDVAGTLTSTQIHQPGIYDLAQIELIAELPRNGTGEVLVPLFGDLKRHQMTDKQQNELGNELLSQRFVDRTIFMTAELWGVASTAPYGHRNDFTTLDTIIRAHGGDARESADSYNNASTDDRSALIAFLKTLVINQ